ncbi:MAG TPA: hypothetical protein VH539_04740 [Gemmatimonadaceae bacterium]
MSKRDQKGPQGHAEGDHGDKTHSRHQKELHSAPREESVEHRRARERAQGAARGRRRLVEDREQHDEAERGSENPKIDENAD